MWSERSETPARAAIARRRGDGRAVVEGPQRPEREEERRRVHLHRRPHPHHRRRREERRHGGERAGPAERGAPAPRHPLAEGGHEGAGEGAERGDAEVHAEGDVAEGEEGGEAQEREVEGAARGVGDVEPEGRRGQLPGVAVGDGRRGPEAQGDAREQRGRPGGCDGGGGRRRLHGLAAMMGQPGAARHAFCALPFPLGTYCAPPRPLVYRRRRTCAAAPSRTTGKGSPPRST